MSHTKGPYHIRHEFNVYAGDRLVASCGGHTSNRDQEQIHAENIANARLFQASPDLLDIAEKYIALCTHCGLFQEAEDAKLLVARVRVGD